MKIQYKSIAGQLVPEEWDNSCECCCFDFKRICFPYSVLACTGTIFEKTETDIFKL